MKSKDDGKLTGGKSRPVNKKKDISWVIIPVLIVIIIVIAVLCS